MKEKFQRFMIGRYGHDEFNQALFILEIIIFVISLFFRHWVLNSLLWVVIIYYMYRTFSKNIVARSLENQRYKKFTAKYRHLYKVFQMNRKDKMYKYFVCSKCSQIVRVPRNKGEVEIKCPVCKSTFSKRT